jgi:type I restriction enzyme M protein
MPTPIGEHIEYEPDSELRDTENVPLALDASLSASCVIHKYFVREVRPYADEAWISLDKTLVGYEISFNKYFYRHEHLRRVDEIAGNLMKIEKDNNGLLKKLINFTAIEVDTEQ